MKIKKIVAILSKIMLSINLVKLSNKIKKIYHYYSLLNTWNHTETYTYANIFLFLLCTLQDTTHAIRSSLLRLFSETHRLICWRWWRGPVESWPGPVRCWRCTPRWAWCSPRSRRDWAHGRTCRLCTAEKLNLVQRFDPIGWVKIILQFEWTWIKFKILA